eukprot:TRINITY_DN18530_c0_g1_i1.p1 TRINITY_DN18530_c0_g1~~TRINITY_DN18530_c0_g1_i1.p1  ORF type:complete len:658 (-),score=113.52 TRINITY_DN18530_c0_g1_i1:249-2222(-)
MSAVLSSSLLGALKSSSYAPPVEKMPAVSTVPVPCNRGNSGFTSMSTQRLRLGPSLSFSPPLVQSATPAAILSVPKIKMPANTEMAKSPSRQSRSPTRHNVGSAAGQAGQSLPDRLSPRRSPGRVLSPPPRHGQAAVPALEQSSGASTPSTAAAPRPRRSQSGSRGGSLGISLGVDAAAGAHGPSTALRPTARATAVTAAVPSLATASSSSSSARRATSREGSRGRSRQLGYSGGRSEVVVSTSAPTSSKQAGSRAVVPAGAWQHLRSTASSAGAVPTVVLSAAVQPDAELLEPLRQTMDSVKSLLDGSAGPPPPCVVTLFANVQRLLGFQEDLEGIRRSTRCFSVYLERLRHLDEDLLLSEVERVRFLRQEAAVNIEALDPAMHEFYSPGCAALCRWWHAVLSRAERRFDVGHLGESPEKRRSSRGLQPPQEASTEWYAIHTPGQCSSVPDLNVTPNWLEKGDTGNDRNLPHAGGVTEGAVREEVDAAGQLSSEVAFQEARAKLVEAEACCGEVKAERRLHADFAILEALVPDPAVEVAKLRSMAKPPPLVVDVLSNVQCLLGRSGDWHTVREQSMVCASGFVQDLRFFDQAFLTPDKLALMRQRLCSNPDAFLPRRIQSVSYTCAVLATWVCAVCRRAGMGAELDALSHPVAEAG